MEELSQPGVNQRDAGFIQRSSSSSAAVSTATSKAVTAVAAAVAPPFAASIYGKGHCWQNPLPFATHHHPFHLEASSSSSSQYASQRRGATSSSDVDTIKARIISHPQYSCLLAAYIDCQKIGAPPVVADRLSAAARELEATQRAALSCSDPPTDPDLDQFMEAYCQMLVKFKEELTRPLQEAKEFLRRAESQLNSITTGSFRVLSSDDQNSGACSSEEDQEGSQRETQRPEIDACAEEVELKNYLLKRYNGHLGSLRQELSKKKKKKGKLPKEAIQKLLNWWELHHKWPYPSETEKIALAELTGLDQKQINNWFINQRKRHWKPSEDKQFFVMEGYNPSNNVAAALYMDGRFMGDGLYHVGP